MELKDSKVRKLNLQRQLNKATRKEQRFTSEYIRLAYVLCSETITYVAVMEFVEWIRESTGEVTLDNHQTQEGH